MQCSWILSHINCGILYEYNPCFEDRKNVLSSIPTPTTIRRLDYTTYTLNTIRTGQANSFHRVRLSRIYIVQSWASASCILRYNLGIYQKQPDLNTGPRLPSANDAVWQPRLIAISEHSGLLCTNSKKPMEPSSRMCGVAVMSQIPTAK